MPTTMTTLFFSALVLCVSAMVVALLSSGASQRARGFTSVAMVAWLGLTFAIAKAGVLRDFESMPPAFMRFMAMSTVLVLAIVLSGIGRHVARNVPLATLIGLQVFRFPLELILHRLHVEGALPEQMTYVGRNFDIITGLLALPVAYSVSVRGEHDARARSLALAFNLIGLGLLANIVTVAVLSVPGPMRVFMNEPANTLVTYVPYVWLPTVLVLTALLGHLLVFRKLREARASTSSSPHASRPSAS